VAEDRAAISALCTDAYTVVEEVKAQAYGPGAVGSLHPAEVALHHRIRDAAADLGVLLDSHPAAKGAAFEFPAVAKSAYPFCATPAFHSATPPPSPVPLL
jgi:hypothetical protein